MSNNLGKTVPVDEMLSTWFLCVRTWDTSVYYRVILNMLNTHILHRPETKKLLMAEGAVIIL